MVIFVVKNGLMHLFLKFTLRGMVLLHALHLPGELLNVDLRPTQLRLVLTTNVIGTVLGEKKRNVSYLKDIIKTDVFRDVVF